MKRLLLLLFCLLVMSAISAQNDDMSAKFSSTGWFNLTQLSFLIAEENQQSPAKSNMAPSLVNINGYRCNEYFSIGLGLGMTAFSYTVFPVFADFRINFTKANMSPVLAIKSGYAFANSSKEIFSGYYYNVRYKNTGGGMFNPEIGFRLMMAERADFMLTIGYYYQHLESEIKGQAYYNMTHNRITDINRLSFSIGFLFK